MSTLTIEKGIIMGNLRWYPNQVGKIFIVLNCTQRNCNLTSIYIPWVYNTCTLIQNVCFHASFILYFSLRMRFVYFLVRLSCFMLMMIISECLTSSLIKGIMLYSLATKKKKNKIEFLNKKKTYMNPFC